MFPRTTWVKMLNNAPGLSNLNQPRVAHCKSCLKVGHLKQNLGGFIDFSKNF